MSNIKRDTKDALSRALVRAFGWFHPIEKKVVFSSFGGKQYSDNPRAISEKLHELYPDYKIVWMMNKIDDSIKSVLPDYVEPVLNTRINRKKEAATCLCSITNVGRSAGSYKRKRQLYIQTWHGDRPLKKILYDAFDASDVFDNKVTDICISGSDAGDRQYRSAFRYEGEILSVGTPRNDRLVNLSKEADFCQSLKKKLNIDEDEKVLLYAPTFRDHQSSKQNVPLNLEETLEHLESKGDKWVCLMRAHSGSSGLNYAGASKKTIDVSQYFDMTDLLCISDMLITDYSSCAGDFTTCNKAVILAIFDRKEYESNCREFAYNLEDTGFLIAEDQQQLNNIIDTYSADDYVKNCQKVNEFFGVHESGHSAEEICNRINKFYEENYNK